MGERVPQHVQNLVIRDYCERNRMLYLLSAAEYAMPDCHLILKQLLGELHELDGIAAYSLFQLPEAVDQRQQIYARLLHLNKTMHFAVEGVKMSTPQECDRVETLWRIRQVMPRCAEAAHSLGSNW